MRLPLDAVLAFLPLQTTEGDAGAQFRFPMPEFETGHTHPDLHTPGPATGFEAIDVLVLFLALSLASWLVLRRRSRGGIFALTIFSVAYFGFWRDGCVCSVGSVQNVVAGLFDPAFVVPWAVVLFFALPLLFALFFGRVFCAAVCPLGAIQEIVAVRPVRIPLPVQRLLGLFPFIYLGLAVLAAALGAGFLICRYDPFVGFFRQSASFNMLITGGLLLVVGVFIARPYCRFLCPYGVLLGWMSRVSKWHATIPPRDCIQCHLCADSCPYGAILTPTPESLRLGRRQGARRLGLLLLLLPILVAVGSATGVVAHEPLSRLHPTVQLAERIAAEDRGLYADQTPASEAFRAGRKTPAELYVEAGAVTAGFESGAGWLGAFLGLVLGATLIGLSRFRVRKDYEPDRAACVSCGRCFPFCPVDEEVTDGDR